MAAAKKAAAPAPAPAKKAAAPAPAPSRPPKPGKAWEWNGDKWVKPNKPGDAYRWNDDEGWVRPDRPGKAYEWDKNDGWVKPKKPGPNYSWDDSKGWVKPTPAPAPSSAAASNPILSPSEQARYEAMGAGLPAQQAAAQAAQTPPPSSPVFMPVKNPVVSIQQQSDLNNIGSAIGAGDAANAGITPPTFTSDPSRFPSDNPILSQDQFAHYDTIGQGVDYQHSVNTAVQTAINAGVSPTAASSLVVSAVNGGLSPSAVTSAITNAVSSGVDPVSAVNGAIPTASTSPSQPAVPGGVVGGGGSEDPDTVVDHTERVWEGGMLVTYNVYKSGRRARSGTSEDYRNAVDSTLHALTAASWGVDLTPLMGVVQKWFEDGLATNGQEAAALVDRLMYSDEAIPNDTAGRKVSDLINARFPGWRAANSNGHSMTLDQYRTLENSYIETMRAHNLPPEMYDQPSDIAKLVANNVAPTEVNARIETAKRALDSSDPSVLNAFQRYYGVQRGDLLAYMLDGDKGQAIIEQRAKAAEVGGAASRYGFSLSEQQATGYGNEGLLSSYGGTNPALRAQTENAFSNAADIRTQDTRLAGIDRQQYNANDAIDVVFGDKKKEMASKKRAEREAARFGGNSGVTTSSIARRRGV